MSLNRVAVSGNLAADPELRRTQGGMAVMSFRLAVNERRKNSQTGEWEDYVNWVSCTMFGTRAEAVSNYLGKGSKVAVDGRLRYSEWERDGQKRSKLEVIVDEIELMSKGANKPSDGQAAQNATPDVQYLESTVFDDDIPFGG